MFQRAEQRRLCAKRDWRRRIKSTKQVDSFEVPFLVEVEAESIVLPAPLAFQRFWCPLSISGKSRKTTGALVVSVLHCMHFFRLFFNLPGSHGNGPLARRTVCKGFSSPSSKLSHSPPTHEIQSSNNHVVIALCGWSEQWSYFLLVGFLDVPFPHGWDKLSDQKRNGGRAYFSSQFEIHNNLSLQG